MNSSTPSDHFLWVMANNLPKAEAWIQSSTDYPNLSGSIRFYATPYAGVLTEIQIFGLPDDSGNALSGFYGIHIHEVGDCTRPFDKTGGHYNPSGADHPFHAGDFPSLLSNQGYAWMSFYDKRFLISEIIGKSVIIHKQRDDFTSQPSGDSGEKIGCGVIRAITNS